MKRHNFRFAERLRVRWAEIDAQQIVFNAHYLSYFDTAVGAYWRALALPYTETMVGLGGDFFVRKATLEYLGSARYDDQLDVAIRCERLGNSSMQIIAAVFRGDELLVHGELIYVFADPASQRPATIPASLRAVIEGFEAGEPVVQVQLGSWAELGDHAGAIRQAVFVQEQKIPAEMEWDAADATCLHAVAFNRFGKALATGRLLPHVPGVAKIGRMAVLSVMRGSRVGREVLEALMRQGKAMGYREVLLHAQLSAAGFYTRAGFVQRGPVFEEAGIGHVEMVKNL
ncbi:YbgC/FadM family acyl-CoA thioesterase [Roseateles koreensis]|uniref:YbgC/FadM family acyl-CoA thioesterase n=1 Tax=Roseateles koreensis TaxID=2987526 RepID=A0ABT5KQW2_9BURK|nr:YbgC/FadM family acyl-CoA thioesterase [Roseateles koreensis]MDC8785293.1 YbgC/FadM family acyl-CoA thioesterase [Roseateles koreensis]